LLWRFKKGRGKYLQQGKREYLNDVKTKDFMNQLNGLLESFIEIPRIKVGKKQTIEALINEEAMLLAKYLRGEREGWMPRITKYNREKY